MERMKKGRRVSFNDQVDVQMSYNPSMSMGNADSFKSESTTYSASPSPLYKQTTPLLGFSSSSFSSFITPTKFGNNISKILPTFMLHSNTSERFDAPCWWKKILDPSSELVLLWNNIFLLACLVALFIDPLFFYLPYVNQLPDGSFCMTRQVGLGIAVTFFRTLTDFFYMLHVAVMFRTAFVARSSRVFGRGELVTDPDQIAKRYIRSGFTIDLIAALPLPQIVIWFVIPAIRSFRSGHMFNALELVVLIQYFARLYLIFPLMSQIINATGVVTKSAWGGAAYNLVLYMLASHVLGAAWYLLSVERQASCWKGSCKHEPGCKLLFMECRSGADMDRLLWANHTNIFNNCDPNNANSTFDFGIFGTAVSKAVVSVGFTDKFFFCLWWGLQQLSSYGQNLQTSTFFWETLFCILISIVGLVLFAHLIGNMQTYLQSITLRLEEWRLKRRDTESWMRHRQLPEPVRARVRRFLQYKWLATRGVDEEAILLSLPTDLRRDIKRHLCLDLVRRVPFFEKMDAQLLDAICERLRSFLSTQGTFIVREGDPVTEMCFIIRGQLQSVTTDGGRSGYFDSITLKQGDFCGEELLAWALLPRSSALPTSTRTVRALVEVEAFSLNADDLKFVANQFRRLHSRKLQHTFRYYSHHWRSWGANYIQATWRRYRLRSMSKSLSLQESWNLSSVASDEYVVSSDEYVVAGDEYVIISEQSHDDEQQSSETLLPPNSSSSSSSSSQAMQNLGATIMVKKFAANTRRGVQKSKGLDHPTFLKPEEPDFSADPDDDLR